MQPGISAEDCLFADIGIDPAMAGCQSFEATDFLLFRRRFDTNSSLVLWQVGVIGDPTFQGQGYDLSGFRVLVDYLIGFYGGQHIAILYEASHYPTYEPMIQPVALADLADAKATAVTTLYVPPKGVTVLDSEMLKLLRLDPGVIHKVAITLGNKLADPPRSANSMATGEKPAFDVAKVLSGPKSTKKQKKVASSDLAQRKLKNKRTDNG